MKIHLLAALSVIGLTWGIQLPLAAQSRVADYTFGGSNQERCAGIIPASDGGFIVGGGTYSGVSGEVTLAPRAPGTALNLDYWIFKMDAQGNKLWEKRYGGSGDDKLVQVLPSADGGYLLCGTTNSPTGFDVTAPSQGGKNYWVVKTDAQGNKLWDKRYGSLTGEMLMAAIAATDGGYLLTGISAGLTSAPSGDRTQPLKGASDIWTIKIDASGNKQWDSTLGGLDGDYVYSAATIPGGGFALLALSFGAVSGDVTGPGNGNQDAWLIKLDAAGNKVWDRLYGGSGYDSPNSLLATADGGLLVAWATPSPGNDNPSQNSSFSLVKLTAAGATEWEQTYTGTGINNISDMKALPDGGYALGGNVSNAVAPNMPAASDYGVINISATGVQRWVQHPGGIGAEQFSSLVVLANGDLLVAGTSESNSGGDKTSNSRGSSDIWVLKMSNSSLLGVTNQRSQADVSLYPNPTDKPLVSLKIAGLREQAPLRLELLNALGQLVYRQQATVRHGSIQQELNIGTLAPGIYTLRIHGVEGVTTRQLIRN